ncbi:phosphoglycerate mutase family protein [Phocaeicola plebeius]|nr:phosphoglycerate mutase family protein [Phocaeicola plebeius]
MKPHRIILIRHGECHANTDESKFATEPDYTIELTEKGVAQAREAGQKLRELVDEESMYFYVSPFWRTRSTFENIAAASRETSLNTARNLVCVNRNGDTFARMPSCSN